MMAFALLGTIALGALFALARAQAERGVKVMDRWRAAARTLGGVFIAPRSMLSSPLERKGAMVTATVGDVEVEIAAGGDAVTHIRAKSPGSGKLTLETCPRGVMTRTSDELATFTAGDAAFDDAHELGATHQGTARAWLSPRVMRAISASAPYSFRLHDGAVRAHSAGLDEDPDRLVRVARAVSAFASRGRELARQWAKLAAALEGEAASPLTMDFDESCAIRLTRSGLEVSVVPERSGDELLTVVRARRAAPVGQFVIHRRRAFGESSTLPEVQTQDEAFDAEFVVRASPDSNVLARLAAPMRATLREVDPARVVSTEAVVAVQLPGLLLDEARARGAVDAACELATDSPNRPYR